MRVIGMKNEFSHNEIWNENSVHSNGRIPHVRIDENSLSVNCYFYQPFKILYENNLY